MNSTPTNELDFQSIQYAFARCIRDPENHETPENVSAQRLAVYQRLFYNNIESFCGRTCKRFREIITDELWHVLIRSFLQQHECTSPYFKDIPLEFITFLASVEGSLLADYPYARELCHFDWVQKELDLAADPTPPQSFKLNNLVQKLVLAPNVRLLSYRWPVHDLKLIKVKKESSSQGLYWFIFVRNLRNRVERISSNARTIRAAELLREPQSGMQILDTLAGEWKTPAQSLGKQLFAMLRQLVEKHVIFVVD